MASDLSDRVIEEERPKKQVYTVSQAKIMLVFNYDILHYMRRLNGQLTANGEFQFTSGVDLTEMYIPRKRFQRDHWYRLWHTGQEDYFGFQYGTKELQKARNPDRICSRCTIVKPTTTQEKEVWDFIANGNFPKDGVIGINFDRSALDIVLFYFGNNEGKEPKQPQGFTSLLTLMQNAVPSSVGRMQLLENTPSYQLVRTMYDLHI